MGASLSPGGARCVRSSDVADARGGETAMTYAQWKRLLILAALVLCGGYLIFFKLFSVVLLMLVSLIVLATLGPIVTWIATRGMPRGLAVVLVMVGIALAILLVGFLVVPPLLESITVFLNALPDLADKVRDRLHQIGVNNGAVNRVTVPSDLASHLVSAGSAVVGFLATAMTIVIISAYLLIDAPRIEGVIYETVPRQYHHHVRYLLHGLGEAVGGYIRGQVINCTIIGTYTFVLLVILHVPHPLPLALIAFFGDVIPVIGLYVILLPLTLAALTVSVPTAIVVIIAISAYTWFESNVLFPNVFGKTLALPPLVIFVAVIIGGELLGFAGAILSLPMAASMVYIGMYVRDIRRGNVPLAIESEAAETPAGDHEPVTGAAVAPQDQIRP
jgi:predicted PurR-regulated permease PerM